MEKDDDVLVLRRIHVVYRLRAAAEQRQIAHRVHGFHKRFCPVYRSIESAIEVTTELTFAEE